MASETQGKSGFPRTLENCIGLNSGDADPIFARYGWHRSLVVEGKKGHALSFDAVAGFIFKCRAFFGVNMRADIYAYLSFHRAITASRLARELGYSQRRIHDTMVEMQMADVFRICHDGNRKEYHMIYGEGQPLLLKPSDAKSVWFDWRSFARGVATIWHKAFLLKEEGLSSYILESEMTQSMEEGREYLFKAGILLAEKSSSHSLMEAMKVYQ